MNAGVGYIAGAQAPNGSFPGKSSAAQRDFKSAISTRTNFNTGMAARILGSVKNSDERLPKVCAAASKFLLSQQSASGSWNYWCTGAARSTLPDDLDDTFCALAAIQLADSSAITPDVLNQAVAVLIAAEELPGGPYRTWIVPGNAGAKWRDVDLAVNCNVAYFLQLQGIRVHALEAYIKEEVSGGNFSSAYYPDALTVKYFLSRLAFVDRGLLEVGEVHGPVSAAMALAIAPKSERARTWAGQILDGVHANGSWPAFGFCLDPVVSGDQYFAGSRCLSTALCVSALEAWIAAQVPVQVQPENLHAAYAVKKFTDELQQFSDSWRALGVRYLKKIEPALVEITSIHVGFARSCGLLETSPALQENSSFMVQLAYASLCGWIAFTIYDDVIDGDAEPTAVVLASHFFSVFQTVYSEEFSGATHFKRFMFSTVRRVTHGNMYELDRCRGEQAHVPNLMNSLRLANRSMGHMVSCTAVLFKVLENGNVKALRPMTSTVEFFRCYLAARQLLDDGHDWKRDYEAGILNAAGCDLVNAHRTLRLVQPISVAWMEREFAEHGLERLCCKVCERVAQARAIVDAEPCFGDKSFFYALVDPIQRSAELALRGAALGKEFLSLYSGVV